MNYKVSLPNVAETRNKETKSHRVDFGTLANTGARILVRPRHTAFRIAFALSRVNAGWSIEHVCDVVGISIATFHRWKRRYEGLRPAEVYRLRRLENENRKLKIQLAKLFGTEWRLRDSGLRGRADRRSSIMLLKPNNGGIFQKLPIG